MTFLVHKSKEITSRREYYFFPQIQEITIFPSMFIFWYLISCFFLSFFFFLMLLFFVSSLLLSELLWPPNPGRSSVLLLWSSCRHLSVRGGLKNSFILLSLCLVLQQGTQVLFEFSIPDPILYILDGNADSGCQWVTGKYWTGKPFWLTLWIIIWK